MIANTAPNYAQCAAMVDLAYTNLDNPRILAMVRADYLTLKKFASAARYIRAAAVMVGSALKAHDQAVIA